MSKTSNYQLTLWDWEDEESLAEINENFGKLDGAAGMVWGQYVGDAQSQDSTLQVIELPKAPVAIFCSGNPGYFSYSDSPWGFFLMQGQTMDRNGTTVGKLEGNILKVGNKINSAFLNYAGTTYSFVLFF